MIRAINASPPHSPRASSAGLQLIPLDGSPPLRQVRNAADLPPREMPGRPPLLLLPEGPAQPAPQGGSNAAVRVDAAAESWRLKSSGSNWESAMEVTMAKLFQLTGLAAPQMGLADEKIASLPEGAWQVASRYDDTFQDLGSFLVSDRAARLASGEDEGRQAAYAEQRARHSAAIVACEDILQRSGVQHFWQLARPDLAGEHAAQDLRRFDALQAMNRMLPAELRGEQLRHYVASSWLANWDHLNYRMENFGYAERDGRPVGMTVDFGSCGPLGFRNLRTGKMLPKSASRDIALLQRPPALFPIPDEVHRNPEAFDTMSGDPGALQDMLRWPYGFQSETIIEMIRPPVAPDPDIVDTLCEMGYRLKLLSGASIAAAVQRYWHVPVDAHARGWPGADTLVEALRARRDALLEGFDDGQLAAWARENPGAAARVRQQMLAALREIQAGDTLSMAAAEARIQARHEALLDPPEPEEAINGLTRQIRSLQAFRNAVRELAAGRQEADQPRIDRAASDLLSRRVYGELVINLHDGPANSGDTGAAFAANLEWLQVMTALVDDGTADAGTVASLLLERCGTDYYPPGVAVSAEAHPEICSAFIGLLHTLVNASPAIAPADLRSGLLQAKNKGQPNFYSILLASDAGREWVAQLSRCEMLPGKEEVRQIKGRVSALLWRGPEGPTAAASSSAAAKRLRPHSVPVLATLLDRVDRSYGPRQLARLEEPRVRERVLACIQLTSGSEIQSVDSMVGKVAADAWQKALQRHPILKGTQLPQDMLKDLQAEARKGFTESMAALRRDQANQIMASGYDRYEEWVLANPTMTVQQRKEAFNACVEGVRVEIRRMVEGEQRDVHATALADVAGKVESRAEELKTRSEQEAERDVQALAEEQARKRAREQASARAGDVAAQQASHRASIEATQKATLQAEALARTQAASRAAENARREAKAKAAEQARSQAAQQATQEAARRARAEVAAQARTRAEERAHAQAAELERASRPTVASQSDDDLHDRLLRLRLPTPPGTPLPEARSNRAESSRAGPSSQPLRRDSSRGR